MFFLKDDFSAMWNTIFWLDMLLVSTSSIAHCPLCILRTLFCDDRVVDCLVATEGLSEVDVGFTREAFLRWLIFTWQWKLEVFLSLDASCAFKLFC